MADNVTLPGTGEVVATDEVSGAQFQRVKLDLGGDGLTVPVVGTVPVSGTVGVSGPVAVTGTFWQATQPVSIAAPVAVTGTFWQATQPVSIASSVAVTGPLTDTQLRASAVPVSGPLTDTQLRATAVPVSGTFWQATQPVSLASQPLPTGAATEVTLATIASAVKAEDAAHTSADAGMFVLAVRNDAEAALAADGDYTPLQTNLAGRLKVSAVPGFQEPVTANITTNTGTVRIDVSRTSNIAFHCVNTGVSGATFNWEASLNSTDGLDGNWFAVQAVQTNANTIGTSATGIGATPAFGWEASVNGYRWFRVRASAGTFGTSTWTIQPAPYATEPIPAQQVSGTQPVSGTVTANIGTGSIAAGTNAIGDVGLQVRANATGAASIHHIVSAATTNVAQIKATAGRVVGWCLSNNSASWRYVKLHNVASATAGSGVVMTIGIQPGGKAECTPAVGIGFGTAISRSIVAGAADADATAIGASEVVGDIFFA